MYEGLLRAYKPTSLEPAFLYGNPTKEQNRLIAGGRAALGFRRRTHGRQQKNNFHHCGKLHGQTDTIPPNSGLAALARYRTLRVPISPIGRESAASLGTHTEVDSLTNPPPRLVYRKATVEYPRTPSANAPCPRFPWRKMSTSCSPWRSLCGSCPMPRHGSRSTPAARLEARVECAMGHAWQAHDHEKKTGRDGGIHAQRTQFPGKNSSRHETLAPKHDELSSDQYYTENSLEQKLLLGTRKITTRHARAHTHLDCWPPAS